MHLYLIQAHLRTLYSIIYHIDMTIFQAAFDLALSVASADAVARYNALGEKLHFDEDEQLPIDFWEASLGLDFYYVSKNDIACFVVSCKYFNSEIA